MHMPTPSNDPETLHRALMLSNEKINELQQKCKYLQEQLDIAHQIGDTFWEALKPLNLVAINVANPGQHVTDVINQLKASQELVSKLTETLNAKTFNEWGEKWHD